MQNCCRTNPQGSPAGRKLESGGGGKILQRQAQVWTEEGGRGVWIKGETRGTLGEGAEESGRKGKGNTGGDRARQWAGRGMGGKRVPGALNSARQTQEARG